jgi:hypothetical protein
MNFSNLNDMDIETRENLDYYHTPTVEEKQMDDFLEKRNLIQKLFKFDIKLASHIAGNKYATLELIKKIYKIYSKYKGTQKEVFLRSPIFDMMMYVKEAEALEALEYIDRNIYESIDFKNSKSIPSGDDMFLISEQLYNIIMLKSYTREKVTPENVIRAIGLYNKLVKTHVEKANLFLRGFAENPSVGMLNSTDTIGGKGRKTNKRKTNKRKSIKRKSIKRKSMKNKRKTYKRK